MEQVDAARQIWRGIADLFFSAENQDAFAGVAEDLGLSPPMVKALLELDPDEGRSMRSLAHEWGCDASFVTVVVDGLEKCGYAQRRVSESDRRVRTVELTPDGAAARERAHDAVYGPRSGFWDLTPDEQVTLAVLLRKLADAQAVHDERLVASGRARSLKASGPVVGHRGFRATILHEARRRRAEAGESWRDHLDAHREELRRLRDELYRVRDEVRAQARAPIDDVKAKAVGDELKAEWKGREPPSG